MEDIVFGPATPVDLPSIRSLLDRCDLPTQDLKGDQLEQFVVCRAGSQLAGVVGVETIGELGVLRSLAVVPELRGRRLARFVEVRSRRCVPTQDSSPLPADNDG
jgi:N-acetylglutamate synthase-like GNAT family acetyltransferase